MDKTTIKSLYLMIILICISFHMIESKVEINNQLRDWNIRSNIKRENNQINNVLRKRLENLSNGVNIKECCPSFEEVIQPKGGVSKNGRILELYRDENSTQSFYQVSCKNGVKGRPCNYIASSYRSSSRCVQKYTYMYALVREFISAERIPWRLDYIRVRSGCGCEIKGNKNSKKFKRIENFIN